MTMRRLKVYLHPVGCPKANVDLEKVSWQLGHEGFEVVRVPGDASVGIVFGCAFIDDAKRESIDDILALARLKQEGSLKHLIVAGCFPEKYARSLCLALPEVDAFVGNSFLFLLPVIVRQANENRLKTKTWTAGPFPDAVGGPHRSVPATSPWTRAVMICDGCDNGCTYCSIPHMRGGLRSREASDILEEIGVLVAQGAKEIVLAGQDTASYGKDTGRSDLIRLVREVAERFPSQWIRLSYVNPDNMDVSIASVIRDYSNICDYLDIPIQHAAPRVLAAMGRRNDPETLRDKIGALRQAIPDIALRTSVIVGFPGETEADIDLLLRFLTEVEFDLVGAFPFSAQEGTPASALKSRVPETVSQDRLIEVVSVQEEISLAKMKTLIGREVDVLIEESTGEGLALGRSRYDMPEIDRVIHLRRCRAGPGEFAKATIDGIKAPYEWSALCP